METAPPCVRLRRPCCSRTSRSRRIVTSDTSSRSLNSSTATEPLCWRLLRVAVNLAFCLSCRFASFVSAVWGVESTFPVRFRFIVHHPPEVTANDNIRERKNFASLRNLNPNLEAHKIGDLRFFLRTNVRFGIIRSYL